MSGSLTRREIDEWGERLEFQKFRIRIHFKVAAVVRVAGALEYRDPLHKEAASPKVCAPSGSIENAAHLLPESAWGMRLLPQLDVLTAKAPTRIGEIRVRPDGKETHRQQMLFVERSFWWKRQNGAAAGPHHRNRPRRELRGRTVMIRDAVGHSNAGATWRKVNLQLLLQMRSRRIGFDRRSDHNRTRVLLNLARHVVRIVGPLDLRRDPQPMPAIGDIFVGPCLASLRRYFVK